MRRMQIENQAEETQSYASFSEARESGHSVFRDADDCLFILTSDGWLETDFRTWADASKYVNYPVRASGERIIIENSTD